MTSVSSQAVGSSCVSPTAKVQQSINVDVTAVGLDRNEQKSLRQRDCVSLITHVRKVEKKVNDKDGNSFSAPDAT